MNTDCRTFFQKQYFQVPGLAYGPEPKSPHLIRINKGKPDQRIQKKIKRERARRSRRDRKKLLREERLRTKIVLREWLLEWSSEGLPAVPTVKRFKKDMTGHHGTEEVTAEVRRMLGKSFKPKIKTKNSQKVDQERRDQAEQMRRRHKEQESSKYRPGSKEDAYTERPRRVKQKQERKKKLQNVKKSKGQEQSKSQEAKSQEEPKGQEESKSQEESKGQEEPNMNTGEQVNSQPNVPSVKSPVISQAEHNQSFSEEATVSSKFSTGGGGEKCNQHIPDLTDIEEEEDVIIKSDQQEECQPTFPDFSDLTFPVNNHLPTAATVSPKFNTGGGEKCDQHIPDITDSEEEEDVIIEADQQEECQTTFPDFSHFTFPVNNHLHTAVPSPTMFPTRDELLPDGESKNLTQSSCEEEEEGELKDSAKAKVLVKRGRRKQPELTDSSDDEESSEPTVKYTGRSSSKAFGDLSGGGNPSQGTSQEFQEVFTMLEALKLAIARTGLPLKLDFITPAEGNCFSHAVIQQCQRAVVREELQRQGRTVTNFMDLKRDVRQFVLSRQQHPRIKEMKANYEQKQGQLARERKPTRGWSTYWEDMLKDGEWADDSFVQATAFYLSLDICLVIADSATNTHLYQPMSGDIESGKVGSLEGPALLIGYISDQHYQSLLLVEEQPSRSTYPVPQGVDHALRRALSALKLELIERSRQVGCNFMVFLNWQNSIKHLSFL